MKKIITGLKITTTNENNQAITDLENIWNKFFEEKYNEKLQKFAKNEKIYTVYTNYKWDFSKWNYDFYIWVETEEEKIEFENIKISENKFKIFEFSYKKPSDTIRAWKTIWENKKIQRSYTFDIEEYDYENQSLKIYISVK